MIAKAFYTMSRWLLAIFASIILRMLHLSWRKRSHGQSPLPPEPVIYALWHGEMQMILPMRPRPLVVLASASRDGRRMATLLRCFGVGHVQGSTSRAGGTALWLLTKTLAGGASVALTVDGPRGPARQAQAGIIALARQSARPIVPVRAQAKRAWIFKKSWDQHTLPKPFSTVDVYFGAAWHPDAVAGTADLNARMAQLLGESTEAKKETNSAERAITKGVETAH